ncbi:arginine--tRNA ligase [Marinicellulosiphila megalodicopiae]|uniref:arginine--tRNA ligase n=1 Tax=Marinicellulosiphila megalodicopiae TaxID=2724896 RepID=UPI003BAFA94A
MNIRQQLNQHFSDALSSLDVSDSFSPNISVSKKSAFGQYQANGAMAVAKSKKQNPREFAQLWLDALQANTALMAMIEKLEIAGPGFINIHLSAQYLADVLKQNSQSERLGVEKVANPQTAVLDYSSPNLAKEMHVGHLRSTIIGDSLARSLSFLGHNVVRQNHVGDWGTQFGMLIAELEESLQDNENIKLKDLEAFYIQSKKHFDEDENFANKARDYVVKLQSGDAEILKLWQTFRNLSLAHSEEIYALLNVTLKNEDVRGESAYNDDLAPVVKALFDQNIASESEGAKVVFLHEMANKNGDPSVAIIQKKEGGYLYATSDLAALRYRNDVLKADRCLYFIDARQSLHMQQVFTIAKKANFVKEDISLEHHAFGTMLGKDGKPFKSRDGGTIKLASLLKESVVRATEIVREKNPDFSDELLNDVASKVGIGAIKYADLSKTRTNDYIFDWDNMLSFEGNTGPYMQYAYARICSIFAKANIDIDSFNNDITLNHEAEFALAFKTLQLSEVVEQVALEAYPHLLCNYLYDLASLFMTFYEACPILKEGVEEQDKLSRLQLSQSVAKTLKQGLELLGIDVMQKM